MRIKLVTMLVRRTPNFVLIGGSLAVDFVNTELVERGARQDLLATDADLVRWARGAGLAVTSAIRSARQTPLVASARTLRAALRALFDARAARRPPSSAQLAVLNRYLESPRRGAPLRYRRGALVRPAAPLGLASVLEQIADDAAALLLTGAHRLRRCANHHCILFFVDRSRRSARRWCSMRVCGNRAKAAAHRHRHELR